MILGIPVQSPAAYFGCFRPPEPVVALAYVDQLQRSDALAPSTLSHLREILNSAATKLESERSDLGLVNRFKSAIKELNSNVVSKDEITNRRIDELTKTLKGIAKRL